MIGRVTGVGDSYRKCIIFDSSFILRKIKLVGDIDGKRKIAALVGCHEGTVNIDVGELIHSTEMEQDPGIFIFSVDGGKSSFVPEKLVRLKAPLNSGEHGLGREGYKYLTVHL